MQGARSGEQVSETWSLVVVPISNFLSLYRLAVRKGIRSNASTSTVLLLNRLFCQGDKYW